jgi:hypothetical protein
MRLDIRAILIVALLGVIIAVFAYVAVTPHNTLNVEVTSTSVDHRYFPDTVVSAVLLDIINAEGPPVTITPVVTQHGMRPVDTVLLLSHADKMPSGAEHMSTTTITTSTPVTVNPWKSSNDTVALVYGFNEKAIPGATVVKIGTTTITA